MGEGAGGAYCGTYRPIKRMMSITTRINTGIEIYTIFNLSLIDWRIQLNTTIKERGENENDKVPEHGFEPQFTTSEAAVLPLDDSGLDYLSFLSLLFNSALNSFKEYFLFVL